MRIGRLNARLLTGCFLGLALSASPARTQDRDAYGAPAAPPPSAESPDDVQQTVARISDMSGKVSYARGDDPDNWQAADRNVPVTLGDRVYTDNESRVELQIPGSYVRLGSQADLAFLNLTGDTKQLALKSGVGSFQLRRLDSNDVFEVDTPNAAVTLQQAGDYRIDVDSNGSTRVSVRQGAADVAAGGGSVPLTAGQAMQIDGTDTPQYANVAIPAADAWDGWVQERETRIAAAASYQHVSSQVVGADDLDQNGRWQNIPTYGWVWTPTVVAAGWAPYRVGQWIWQDPWGWTWVSAEPWGWAPYHYGRWVSWSSSWFWVPVAPRVAVVAYRPALVAFVGGGPGWSVSVAAGGYVGWFPLAPHEPFIPWWGHPRVAVTNVTYVNRTYVTVVNRTTFVGGGVVTTGFVRDAAVIREVGAAPILRGPLPVVPTRQAIFVAPRPGVAVVRPPAAVVARPVVARVAPPPAPPLFQSKLAVIEQNHGAPVAPRAAAELAVRDRGRAEAITTVRPVASQSGRVTLAPRAGQATAAAAAVAPVAPVRGRPMATSERPVASAPVSSSAPSTNAATSNTGSTRDHTRSRAPSNAGNPPASAAPASGSTRSVAPHTQSAAPAPAPARSVSDKRPAPQPTPRGNQSQHGKKPGKEPTKRNSEEHEHHSS